MLPVLCFSLHFKKCSLCGMAKPYWNVLLLEWYSMWNRMMIVCYYHTVFLSVCTGCVVFVSNENRQLTESSPSVIESDWNCGLQMKPALRLKVWFRQCWVLSQCHDWVFPWLGDRNEFPMETHDAGFFDSGLPILLGGSLHICTHVLVGADEVMGSHGNSSVLFVMKLTKVWHFVGNSHKAMRAHFVVQTLIRLWVCTLCQVTFKLLLWKFSLQFHAFYIYSSGFWYRNMDILHNLKQTFNLSLVKESHESSL